LASQSFSLRTLWAFLWPFRLAILLAMVVGAVGGLAWCWLTPPIYEVSAALPVVIRQVDSAGWDALKVDSVYAGMLEVLQSNLVYHKTAEKISAAHQSAWQKDWADSASIELTAETFRLRLRDADAEIADECLTAWAQSSAEVLRNPETRSQAAISAELVSLAEMGADLWVGEPESKVIRRVDASWLESGAAGSVIATTTMILFLLFLFSLKAEST